MSKDMLQAAITHDAGIRAAGHAVSLGAIFATLEHVGTGLLMILPILWYCLCIYESKTCQTWLRYRRRKRKAKKNVHL